MRNRCIGRASAIVALVVTSSAMVWAHPAGPSIAINFASEEPNGAGSEVLGPAGVLGTTNWNNLLGPNGGPEFLVLDDNDEPDDSDVTVEWVSNNTWASDGRGEANNTAPDGDDRNLMIGYLDTNADTANSVTVTGLESLTDEPYDVYVYMTGGVPGRGGDYTIGDEVIAHVTEGPFDGNYNEGFQFIVFQGVEGDSFTLTGQPTTGAPARAPINAIEIVTGDVGERVVPERALTQAVSAEECAPGGRGPVDVAITQIVGAKQDPAEMIQVEESILGAVSTADIGDVSPAAASMEDVFPDASSDEGFIRTWLMLGPFEQGGGAAPGFEAIQLDYLTDGDAIDEIDVEPSPGDTVDTDFGGLAASTGLAATTNGINPGGVPTWTEWVDEDNTVNFNDYYGGDINNIMMYAVTYITLEDDAVVDLCVGSDDAVQILIDGVEVHLNDVARGVGGANECQDTVPVPDDGLLSAGEQHRIMVKVFEGGGGHQFRLGLLDPFTLEPVPFTACSDPDEDPCAFDPVGAKLTWDVSRETLAAGVSYSVAKEEGQLQFVGAVDGRPTSGDNRADLSCDTRVTGLTCARADGGATVSWENSPFADAAQDIEVQVNGTTVATVAGDASEAALSAADVGDEYARICVVNSAGSTCCVFLASGVMLGDVTAGGDGTGNADPSVVGINADLGVLEIAHQNGGIQNTGDAFQLVDEAVSPYIDAVFLPEFEENPINSAGVNFLFDLADVPALVGATYNHIIRDVTHDIDKGITSIWAGGIDTWISAVSIHSSAGITYDLEALRDVHGELDTFEAFGGVDQCGSALLNAYVILSNDEEVIDSVSLLQLAASTGEDIELEIPEEATFLSLVVGFGDGGNACDHGVFANARITTSGGGGGGGTNFVRGDADASGAINITDGIFVLNFLFLGGPNPPCEDAADADDSSAINITDGIYILNFLFLGGPDPAAPHPGIAVRRERRTTME